VGHRVLTLLQAFNQPLVGIASQLQYPELLYQAPLLIGPVLQELKSANLATARSVIAVTDDPMLNLEIALIVSEAAAARGHAFVPVIRTLNQAFSDNLSVLLPQAKAFSVYALSAEAFAGAAFGENILSLFRLREQTILVTEYRIEADDTLNGLLLAEVAYGYGVMPILLETRNLQGHWESLPLPGDDLQLHPGDRLYILASINGLRRIERGERTAPRRWRLEIEQPLNHQVLLDAGNILAKLSGLELSQCRTLMKNLPAAVVLPLYDYQAQRLQEKLKRYLPIRLLML
jgi:Trk K+ transport system NAD-binding subunit